MQRAGPSAGTGRLLQLCAGYFAFYVLTGVLVKYFRAPAPDFPGLSGIAFLTNSTIGGNGVVLVIIVGLGWIRLRSNRILRWGPLRFPSELRYIFPSGVCTGIIIPATTLLYSFRGLSVMVAMVIMRGSVIVISRLVDAVQIRQGILRKRVYWEENVGVVLACAAVATHLFGQEDDGFAFLQNTAAIVILSSYVVAYAIRIYIMNYYKNTRAPGVPHDNRGFFACEQLAATATLIVMAVLFFQAPALFGWEDERVFQFREATANLDPAAIAAGIPFGLVAFFSVFIFLFQGRTATFAGLVNRLTSLIAGVVATLVFWLAFDGRQPASRDWISLGLIGVAVIFLARAEKKRAAELLRDSDRGPGER